jgi:hypothetical protein
LIVVKEGSSSSETTSFVTASSMLKLRIGQHPIRLEESDRPAGPPIYREVSKDFANDTGELEAVARAWRRQDNLRRLRVQTSETKQGGSIQTGALLKKL